MQAKIITDKGTMKFEMYDKDAPGTGAGGLGYTIDCELSGEQQYHAGCSVNGS